MKTTDESEELGELGNSTLTLAIDEAPPRGDELAASSAATELDESNEVSPLTSCTAGDLEFFLK